MMLEGTSLLSHLMELLINIPAASGKYSSSLVACSSSLICFNLVLDVEYISQPAGVPGPGSQSHDITTLHYELFL